MSENRIRLATFLLVAQIFGAAAANAQTAPAQPREALTPGSFKAYAPESAEARLSDFSGQPVPRYASLRYDNVNGRSGPSVDYPVRWTYERQGLPVIVIRESQDWRKIRDPQGDEVWVDKTRLAAERTAITTTDGAIQRDPNAGSAAIARFAAGAVVSLGACSGLWCRVSAEGHAGWALREQLWGADALPPAPGNR